MSDEQAITRRLAELYTDLVEQRTSTRKIATMLAECEAERNAYKAKWEGVPLNPLADVIDHYRAGLEIKYVEPRLYLAMNWLMDNSDWVPALPYRHTRKKGDGLYTINAPKEIAE